MEVAAAVALRGFFKASVNDKELLARLTAAQLVFFGKSNETVDYQIMLSAKKDAFLVVDESSMEIRKIKAPLSKCKILLMDSRVPRFGVDTELRRRRRDIKKGLELLSPQKEGDNLRSFVTADLIESMGDLPEEIRRRCMHIVQELRRVNDAEEAIKNQDYAGLAKVFFHSHESLRDLYEVSCPEVDWLVKRAQEIEGVLGSRMTGQGFGGCTFTIIKDSSLEDYRRRLEDYERIFGFHPLTYEVKPATGARLIHETVPKRA
jgi:galactokinase